VFIEGYSNLGQLFSERKFSNSVSEVNCSCKNDNEVKCIFTMNCLKDFACLSNSIDCIPFVAFECNWHIVRQSPVNLGMCHLTLCQTTLLPSIQPSRVASAKLSLTEVLFR
jgi:hypothetical protein